MLFNSYAFLFVFLPVVLITFHMIARWGYFRLATASLVFASLIFYAYWDYKYLALLGGSIIFNFVIGKKN